MLSWEGHPGMVPLLQCYIGTASSPMSYPSPDRPHKTTSSLRKWFETLVGAVEGMS